MSDRKKNRQDERLMAAAIRYARRHQGLTGTNPSVACLLVDETVTPPRLIGAGVTALGGRPHAEPLAIETAVGTVAGAAAYVTLEPCAHHGRTPPCAQTLITAKVARVITAITDPDSRVCGKGHEMLRAAGIEVTEHIGADDALPGLACYLNQKKSNRAQVTLKLAVSADGCLGLRGRGQVAITGEIARAQTHLLRANHHAIMVGAGTVCEDDPSLTCRLPGLGDRSPARVILDPHGHCPIDAAVFQTANQVRTLVAAPHDMNPDRRAALMALGCEILPCELHHGRVALPELLEDLSALGIVSVLAEGGASLAASLMDEDLVDELLLFEGATEICDKGREPVRSPFLPGEPPAGFTREYHLELGADRMTRYRRHRNNGRH